MAETTNNDNYIILESWENRDGTANVRILGLFVMGVWVCYTNSSSGIPLVNQLFSCVTCPIV